MMQRKLQWLVLLSAVPLTFGFAQFKPGLTPVSKELKDGFNSIKPDDGRKILAYLAGPECEGGERESLDIKRRLNTLQCNSKKPDLSL